MPAIFGDLGGLGFLAVRHANQLILYVYHLIPQALGQTAVWGLLAVGMADFAGSMLSMYHMEEKVPRLLGWNHKMQQWTYWLAAKMSRSIERRIRQAYPSMVQIQADETGKEEQRCDLIQLFWLFLIGAFLGDVVETVFCRITTGRWMSRSSLVWGPFSIVWGLAIALITALLYRDRDKPDQYIFWTGTFLGGAYEYICSVFTEIVFGKVFWDYSAMPFNLGGRINLLYCFFWGIAAVVWIKGLYPKIAWLLAHLRCKMGRVLTVVAMICLALDMCVSVLALVRYDTRANGAEAVFRWEWLMDMYFDDNEMERIYPNAIPQ